MQNKNALLDDLKIDADDRQASSKPAHYLIIALLASGLGAGGWWWLFPHAQAITVSTTVVVPAMGKATQSSNSVLEASGYVTARRQATVSSKVTGKVAAVFVEEGIRVQKGQVLASLDDSAQRLQFNLSKAQLQASRAGLGELEVQLHEAQLTLKRILELSSQRLASEAELDRASLAVEAFTARLNSQKKQNIVAEQSLKLQQQFLDDLQIRAPFSGVIIAKSAQPGEMISPVSAGGGFTRTGICTIVDMSSLEIEVDVNESYINRVTPGQPVTAILNSYPEWLIPAEVITIIPTADRNKATVRVRIAFLERDQRILPDMGVKVSFMDEQPKSPEPELLQGVLIPQDAVRRDGGQTLVFVVEGETARMRLVTLGGRFGGQRNILTGLSSGEVIIATLDDDSLQQLQDGSIININN